MSYQTMEDIESFFGCSAHAIDGYILRLYLSKRFDNLYLDKCQRLFQLTGFDYSVIGSPHFAVVPYNVDVDWANNICRLGITDWALTSEKMPGRIIFWFRQQVDLTLITLSAA